MSPRPYQLGQRQAASEQTRSRVLQAARKLLMESTSFSGFSIEAVARRADVARMTIYHQFGSKMGLLEALCDSLAVTGETEQLMVFPTLRRSSSPSVGASGVGLALSPTLFKSGGRRSMLRVCHGRANSSTGNRARWSEPDLRDRAVPIARSPCRVDHDDHSAPAAHYGCRRRLAA